MSAARSLREVPNGAVVQIRSLGHDDAFSHRLRELGFCENAVIRCITNLNGHVVCELAESRMGMNRNVARSILVTDIGQ
jgi:Fe2+ transport system protein FeoA